MKYILTQEELNDLQQKATHITEDAQKILQDLCTRLADLEPVKEGWYAGKPWGCIHTKKDYEWYCDCCPVQDVCPEPYKNWSK